MPWHSKAATRLCCFPLVLGCQVLYVLFVVGISPEALMSVSIVLNGSWTLTSHTLPCFAASLQQRYMCFEPGYTFSCFAVGDMPPDSMQLANNAAQNAAQAVANSASR